jgi:hypothetical protein
MKKEAKKRIYIEVIILFGVAIYLWYRLMAVTGIV